MLFTWPQIGSSHCGVNQRIPNFVLFSKLDSFSLSPDFNSVTKDVIGRFISAAILAFTFSSKSYKIFHINSGFSFKIFTKLTSWRGQTAAWLPEKTSLVKASTTKIRIDLLFIFQFNMVAVISLSSNNNYVIISIIAI